MSRRWQIRLAFAALVLATPFATWWLIGDVSEDLIDPTYLFRQPSLSTGTERAIGIVAVALAGASLGVLIVTHLRRPFSRRRIGALACLVAAGVVVGGGYRVVTAGVSGANIGGGMIVLGGPFLVGGLVLAAISLFRPPRPVMWLPPANLRKDE